MTARTPKSKVKATVTHIHQTEQPTWMYAFKDVDVSWTRTATSWVVGLVVAAGLGYAAGAACSALLLGFLVLGHSLFLATAIAFISAIVLSLWSQPIYMRAYNAVRTGEVDALFNTACDKVRSVFSKEVVS